MHVALPRASRLEGVPLLHVDAAPDDPTRTRWSDWLRVFGGRRVAPERGTRFADIPTALKAAREGAGYFICGLSLVQHDLAAGTLVLPFPIAEHLVAANPYRLALRPDAAGKPQLRRFAAWLADEARETRTAIEAMAA
jgi:LysR family glycine cleavage system transcriptional activator